MFDGDILNIIALKTKKLIKEFRGFDPKRSFFISNNDGLFNDEMNLIKDEMIGLYQFCNV